MIRAGRALFRRPSGPATASFQAVSRLMSAAARAGRGAGHGEGDKEQLAGPDLRSFVLETKAWSVKAHLRRAEELHGSTSRAALSDEDVEKVADYAHLELPARDSPEFVRIKEDLASVLAASAAIKDFLASRRSSGVGAAESDAGEKLPYHEQYRRKLTPEEATELARARMAELRKDEPREGGDAEALLKHAAKRSGQYFVVPRTVEG